MQKSQECALHALFLQMDLFVVNEMQPILRAESTVTAHPVSVTSNSTHHLDALFDRIVYSKVSSEGFQSLSLPLGVVDWAMSSWLSLYDEYSL